MNEKTIKSLLKEGLCIHHSNERVVVPFLPNTDLTLHRFYMLGKMIVDKDDNNEIDFEKSISLLCA